MLQFIDVHLKRGDNEIFDKLNLTIHAGHRVGVVGRNGVGKTTLFLLIRQRLLPDEGDVLLPNNWRIAHMQQEPPSSDLPALEFVLDGDKALRRVQGEIRKAEDHNDDHTLGELYAKLEAVDGYTAESRAAEVMYGLGFTADDLVKPVSEFSGGWRIRLNLAQTLMCPSDLLLLDEPTNHLDLDAIIWLETWLRRYPGTLLVISHDRDFLDRTVTHIAHLSGRRAMMYRGNYASFERQHSENQTREQSLYRKQQERIAEIERFVARFRAKASKARQAQSRLKELERMVRIAPAHVDSPFDFTFPNPKKISNPVLTCDHAAFGYDAASPVLTEVMLRIYPGSRIGLLGRNGAGKTTLLRTLAGELPLLGGDLFHGQHSPTAYFAQHQVEILSVDESPLWHLQSLDEDTREQTLRDYLGGWGFPGKMAIDPIRFLSGGEKARVALALIASQRPALLLLDEPTNHLDLEMRLSLTLALQSYDGAIVIVSHDRHLLRNVADEFLLVADAAVRNFDGDLDDYASWLKSTRASAGLGAGTSTGLSAGTSTGLSAGGGGGISERQSADRRNRRRASARQRETMRPLRERLQSLEARVTQLHAKVDTIEARLADAETYEDKEMLTELLKTQAKAREDLAAAEDAWLAASEALEEAERRN
ncbi:MAG: ATP-binding cassette domain-containing protein [Pseudomonadales bacterium]